jgi:hypothetical protein
VASANKDGLLSILDRSRVSRSSTPADLTAVLPLLSQTPTTTRENVDAPLSRDHLVRFCPGIQGGVEWNGAAFSPETDSLFVAAVDWCANVQVKRNTEEKTSRRRTLDRWMQRQGKSFGKRTPDSPQGVASSLIVPEDDSLSAWLPE